MWKLKRAKDSLSILQQLNQHTGFQTGHPDTKACVLCQPRSQRKSAWMSLLMPQGCSVLARPCCLPPHWTLWPNRIWAGTLAPPTPGWFAPHGQAMNTLQRGARFGQCQNLVTSPTPGPVAQALAPGNLNASPSGTISSKSSSCSLSFRGWSRKF